MTNGRDAPSCRLLGAGDPFTGKQGLRYAVGISAESAGSQGLHLQIVTLPPLAKAKAHKHEAHESAIYVISGESGCWFGEGLAERAMVRAGDFFYIPAGAPHLPYNPSDSVPCVTVIARTDPNEQESVVLLPNLDAELLRRSDPWPSK
jgi:uncharacterized RmlC-like cupin family protein